MTRRAQRSEIAAPFDAVLVSPYAVVALIMGPEVLPLGANAFLLISEILFITGGVAVMRAART